MSDDETITTFVAMLPKHAAGLHIRHNDHKGVYESVESHLTWCEGEETGEGWISLEDRAKAIETDELWEVQWYPNTPVGFNVTFGSTLFNAMAAAKSE